jgi:hypothetical protein
MSALVVSSPEIGGDGDLSRVRRRWRTRISREQERRFYFLATVVVAAWYLMTHVL